MKYALLALVLMTAGVVMSHAQDDMERSRQEQQQEDMMPSGQSDQALEVRVIVLDKNHAQVNLTGATAILRITPTGDVEDTEERTIPMKLTEKGLIEKGVDKMGELGRGQEAGRQGTLFLGEFQEVDDYLVKVIVIGPTLEKRPLGRNPGALERHAGLQEQPGVEQDKGLDMPKVRKFAMHEEGSYFTATLGGDVFPKAKAVMFDATAILTIGGDEHEASFSYPIGYYETSVNSMIEELDKVGDMVDEERWEEVSTLASRIHESLAMLPALAFEDDATDKLHGAYREAQSMAQELQTVAQNRDQDAVEDAVDRLEEKLNALVDVSQDAIGVPIGMGGAESQPPAPGYEDQPKEQK